MLWCFVSRPAEPAALATEARRCVPALRYLRRNNLQQGQRELSPGKGILALEDVESQND